MAHLSAALTIRTTYTPPGSEAPYQDEVGPDGTIRYKWRGHDPQHADNRALRRAMLRQAPLAYFIPVTRGVYQPVYPVYLVDEDRGRQEFTVEVAETLGTEEWSETELKRRRDLGAADAAGSPRPGTPGGTVRTVPGRRLTSAVRAGMARDFAAKGHNLKRTDGRAASFVRSTIVLRVIRRLRCSWFVVRRRHYCLAWIRMAILGSHPAGEVTLSSCLALFDALNVPDAMVGPVGLHTPTLLGVLIIVVGLVAAAFWRRRFDPPRELPPPPTGSVARDSEIDRMVSFLLRPGSGRLAVISGPPGQGKTDLALRVAYRVKHHFSDGQLFHRFDRRGNGTDPADAALSSFVKALHGFRPQPRPGPWRPGGPNVAPGMLDRYRSLLARRRILVVLDDASDVTELVRLLPPGRRSAMIAITREPLEVTPGQLSIHLGPLDRRDSLAVLRTAIGDRKVTAEPDAADRIIAFAGGYPLALKVIGVALQQLPVTLSQAVQRLPQRPEDTHGRTGLDLGMALLPEAQRTVVTVIGLLAPDEELTAWRIAAMLYERPGRDDLYDAGQRLGRLVATGLIERYREDTTADPVYVIPDHVREYARTLAARLPDEERARYRERLLRATTERDDIAPDMMVKQAYRWLAVGQLAEALESGRTALQMAERCGDGSARGAAYAALAEVRAELGDLDQAKADAEQSLTLAEEVITVTRAHRVIGRVHRMSGRAEAATHQLGRAVDAAGSAGDPTQRIRALAELATPPPLWTDPWPNARTNLTEAYQLCDNHLRRDRQWLRALVLQAEVLVCMAEARVADQRGNPAAGADKRGDAVGLLAQATDIAQAGGQELHAVWLLYTRAELRFAQQLYEDSQVDAIRAMERFVGMRHAYAAARCRFLLGQIDARKEAWDDARRKIEEADRDFCGFGDKLILASARRWLRYVQDRDGR